MKTAAFWSDAVFALAWKQAEQTAAARGLDLAKFRADREKREREPRRRSANVKLAA